MCSAFRRLVALACAAFAGFASAATPLRVCLDPDNLPFSHADGRGFETELARLLAEDLHRELEITWMPLRRGFVRKTAGAGLCDAFMGVPKGFDRVLTTRPYYRSSYVFVAPAKSPLASFEDARLPRLRIGVQLVGNDMAATPPGHALTLRGATRNVHGYTVYGDGPAAQRIVHDLDAGALDAALVWGPAAGYFAHRARMPLELHEAQAPPQLAAMPFSFAIAVGVKRGETALRDEIDAALARRRPDIDALLAAYDVPRMEAQEPR